MGNAGPILLGQYMTFWVSMCPTFTNIPTILTNFLDTTIQFLWKTSVTAMATLANSSSKIRKIKVTDHMIVINRVYCRYRTLTNQCGDPTGYLPKRIGVTRPVYDCGQGNYPLGQVPGGSAGRLGVQNFQKGYALPLTPHYLCTWSASPLVWREKSSPNRHWIM